MPGPRKILFYSLPPLLAFIAAMSVSFQTDLSAFIIAGDKAEEIVLASEMQSGALSRRYLLSVGSNREKPVSKDFIQALRTRLRRVDGVVDVWLPEQQNEMIQAVQGLYSRYGSALYSLEPERDLAEIFSPAGLARKAEFLKKALLSPQAPMIKKFALTDPLLLSLHSFQGIDAPIQPAVEPDRRYRNLILESAMAGLDWARQSRVQDAINQTFKQFNQSRNEQFELAMTGIAVFAVATQKLIQGDIIQLGILSSIALMALFWLIFRSFSTLFQVFTLLIIVMLSAVLATQLAFGSVHGMTVAIGTTLVGICIDYPIHAVAHAQAVQSDRRNAVIARIWPAMLLGGITTLIGYTALGASGFPGFRQVAVYTGAGIVAALLLTRFMLPGLIAANSRRQLNIVLIAKWVGFCWRFRRVLIVVLIVLTVASLFGLNSIRWLEDMQDLTPELNYLKENDKRIRARMVSIEPGRFILVTGKDIEAALRKTEQVYAVLELLKQKGLLSDYFGLYPWLLSAHQQQQNRLLLRKYLTAQNLRLWRQALAQQGLSVDQLGHFDYPGVDALSLEQVFATPVKRLLDSRVLITRKQTMVMVWLAAHQPEALQQAFAEIEGARYFSQRDLINRLTQDYTRRARILFSAGLAMIVVLLAGRYRSGVKTVQTLLPAVLAAVWIPGIWSLSGAPVSFLHLVGFLLVVAICVDYGIFYQENRSGNILLTYQAMAASMLTSVLAFGCLITAESASLRILAGVVTLGVLLGFLFCPIIIEHTQGKS